MSNVSVSEGGPVYDPPVAELENETIQELGRDLGDVCDLIEGLSEVKGLFEYKSPERLVMSWIGYLPEDELMLTGFLLQRDLQAGLTTGVTYIKSVSDLMSPIRHRSVTDHLQLQWDAKGVKERDTDGRLITWAYRAAQDAPVDGQLPEHAPEEEFRLRNGLIVVQRRMLTSDAFDLRQAVHDLYEDIKTTV